MSPAKKRDCNLCRSCSDTWSSGRLLLLADDEERFERESVSFWVRSFGVGVGVAGVVGEVVGRGGEGGGSEFWRLGGVVVKYFWIVPVRGGWRRGERRRGRKESVRRGGILLIVFWFWFC